MTKKTPLLLPRLNRLSIAFGDNLKKARLRRGFSAETVAQRAGISRKTLYRAERGDPAVAFGTYARILQVLRLESDLAQLAADDVVGRKLQDMNLKPRRRAAKRPSNTVYPGKPHANSGKAEK